MLIKKDNNLRSDVQCRPESHKTVTVQKDLLPLFLHNYQLSHSEQMTSQYAAEETVFLNESTKIFHTR
jgi:hypothetical protein